MKLGEKLKTLRKQNHLSVQELKTVIEKNFGQRNALAAQTIYNIENDFVKPKTSTLYKFCQAYKLSLMDLIQGTNYLADLSIIRKKERHYQYICGQGALAHKVSIPSAPFEALELNLEPLSSAQMDCDIPDQDHPMEFRKFVYVISGRLKIQIGGREENLQIGDTTIFDSTLRHCFKNIYKKKCVALIIKTQESKMPADLPPGGQDAKRF